MKVTLGQLLASQIVLNKLATEKLPAKTSYRLMRVLRKVGPEMETYNKAREALFTKYGAELNAEKTQWVFPPEHQEAINQEHLELLENELDLGCLPLPLEDLGMIATQDLMMVDWLVEEPKAG